MTSTFDSPDFAMVIGTQDVLGDDDAVSVIDPNTGRTITALPGASPAQLDAAMAAARAGAGAMRSSTPADRAAWMRALAQELLRHHGQLTGLEIADVGKVRAEAEAEISGAAAFLETLADECEQFSWTTRAPDGRTTYTWDPMGVIASILPWNAPIAAIARRIGICIASGNATVIKPSELAPLGALAVTRLARRAGLPPGSVNSVIGGPDLGRRLARHPQVDKVAFTGGPAAGAEILQLSAETMRPVAVELGGKSPQVVLDDADPEVTIDGVVRALIRNAGQVCTTGSRLLVQNSVADELLSALHDRLAGLRVGSAHDDATDMGPIISAQHRDRIEGFVAGLRDAGHPVRTLGTVARGEGYFVAPSIVENAAPGDAVFDEEVFGPVLAVTRFDTDAEAVALANATRFGLVAGVWTRDTDRGSAVARQIDAGLCWINGYWASPMVASRRPRRSSGTGWMDFGIEGIKEYLWPKAITIS